MHYCIQHAFYCFHCTNFVLFALHRLLKKLRQKSSHEIELEKKEQGFALYLNGANISQSKRTAVYTSSHRPPGTRRGRQENNNSSTSLDSRKRTSKTAGMGKHYHLRLKTVFNVCVLF